MFSPCVASAGARTKVSPYVKRHKICQHRTALRRWLMATAAAVRRHLAEAGAGAGAQLDSDDALTQVLGANGVRLLLCRGASTRAAAVSSIAAVPWRCFRRSGSVVCVDVGLTRVMCCAAPSEGAAPIQAAVKAGIVPKLVAFVSHADPRLVVRHARRTTTTAAPLPCGAPPNRR